MGNSPFKTHTFKSTGVTVIVPPVSVLNLQSKFMRKFPPPPPPMVEVDMGNGPELQPNESDPDWIKSLTDHQNDIGLKVMEAVMLRIALKQVLSEKDLEEVREFREVVGEVEELHENDKVVWFQEIASGDDAELSKLAQIASGISDPTAEGVDLEVKSFRDAVQES